MSEEKLGEPSSRYGGITNTAVLEPSGFSEPPPSYDASNSATGGATGGYNPPMAGYQQSPGFPAQSGYPQQYPQPYPQPYPQQSGFLPPNTVYPGQPTGQPGYPGPSDKLPATPVVITQQPTRSAVLVGQDNPPKHNEWQHKMSGCFDNCGLCILACCCPCYLIGKNAEQLGENKCLFCCCSVFAVFRLVLQTALRARIRDIRGIKGSLIGDCCWTYWCTCCALIQDTREVAYLHGGDPVIGPVEERH